MQQFTSLAKWSTLHAVVDACQQAGNAIMEIYSTFEPGDEIAKDDGSPLTKADLAANKVLMKLLPEVAPNVPILSEESLVPWKTRREWNLYWLVDPLDGTKEFIAKNGEFTVNVALVCVNNGVGEPVLGVVHAPATQKTYAGLVQYGAFKLENGKQTQVLSSGPDSTLRIVASRSHASSSTDRLITALKKPFAHSEVASYGSSLKLCAVAEGGAHIYPRLAPTSEWDTAAAHAVVVAAGGRVLAWPKLKPLTYAKEDLLNPFFVVLSTPDDVIDPILRDQAKETP